MKKALTLAVLILGFTAFAQICRAESTNSLTSSTTSVSTAQSFSFLIFTAHLKAETTYLLQLDLQKSSNETYLCTVHYSAQIAANVHLLLRILFIAYIVFLFKKNLPLLIPHHA